MQGKMQLENIIDTIRKVREGEYVELKKSQNLPMIFGQHTPLFAIQKVVLFSWAFLKGNLSSTLTPFEG